MDSKQNVLLCADDKYSKILKRVDHTSKLKRVVINKLQRNGKEGENKKINKIKYIPNNSLGKNFDIGPQKKRNLDMSLNNRNMIKLDQLSDFKSLITLPDLPLNNTSRNIERPEQPISYKMTLESKSRNATNLNTGYNKYPILDLPTKSNSSKNNISQFKESYNKENKEKAKKKIEIRNIRDDRGYYPKYEFIKKKIFSVTFSKPKVEVVKITDPIPTEISASSTYLTTSNLHSFTQPKIKGIKFENYSTRKSLENKSSVKVLTYDEGKIIRDKKKIKTIDFTKTTPRGLLDMIKKQNIPAPGYYEPNYTQISTEKKTFVNYRKRTVIPGKKFQLLLA